MAIRILDHLTHGTYTPITKPINNFADLAGRFERVSGFDDSLRQHIPKLLAAMYGIRNKRSIAHVGKINPNFMDATLGVTICDWIIADFLRIYHNIPIEETQKTIDGLIRRRIPLVYDLDERRRVLNPRLNYPDKSLVLLYDVYPESISDSQLAAWTEHSNTTVFKKKILKKLHENALIDWHEGKCLILPPGLRYVEKNLSSLLIQD